MFTKKEKLYIKKGNDLFNNSDKLKRPLVSHLEFNRNGQRGTLVFLNGRLGLTILNPKDGNFVRKEGKDRALLRVINEKNTIGVLQMPFKTMKVKYFISLSLDFEYMDVKVIKKIFNIK